MARGWLVALVGLICLTGCPDNEYDYRTWTKKLKGKDGLHAATKLQELGNPDAIPALGDAWLAMSKPSQYLQAMISLAPPLTAAEAEAQNLTDFAKTGRKASWDKALPYLIKALTDVDEADDKSVESAGKAADALGTSKLEPGLDALVEFASKPVKKKLASAQVRAIRAIGMYDNAKAKAAAALNRIIDRDVPAHPRTAKDEQAKRSLGEEFERYLGVTGAAINALGELRDPTAAKTLARQMYRTPELFTQIRRALAATGPTAKEELRKILRGEHAEVNQLFKDKKLDRYCGDKGDVPSDQCLPVSAKDFYPAVILGDFYDPATAKDLLGALQRPMLPVYYMDEQPSPNSQYHAIFDALRKIGAPEGAAELRAMWMPKGKGKGGGGGIEDMVRILAISAYPFVVRDMEGVEDLGAIAADNSADDGLRQEAATAFARLSRDASGVKILESLAQKYFDASAQKRKEADGKPKAEAAAADKDLEKAKKAAEEARQNLVKMSATKSVQDIKLETKKIEDALKAAKKKHKEGVAGYKGLDGASKAYKNYARMFQTHIARIEIAIRCKDDLKCYAASLTLKPDEAAANNKKYIKDIAQWTKEEKQGLVEANVERAMLEIGKRGAKAQEYTALLLDHAKSDNRLIRQSILLALPKIAKVPCDACETKLNEAIKAGEGKGTLADLNLETTMLRNYFTWAGGRTPTSKPVEASPAEAAPAEKPAK
ncbi:MAG: hypothetical protein AB7R00_31505 [Kofleriaceae bacterium]